MTRRSIPVPSACLLAALIGLAGCQAAPRTILAARPVAPAEGRVSVDLGAIAAAWAPRRLQALTRTPVADPRPYDVLDVRLVVRGLGMTPRESQAVSIVGDDADLRGPLELELAVPAGHNRVFELQGLNADGQVARRLRGTASVAAGQGVAVTVDALSDAAARVIDQLLTGDDLPPALAEALATADRGAALRTYIDRHARRRGTDNEYAGLNPVFFRDHLLADRLRANGVAYLETAESVDFEGSAGSPHSVLVRDHTGAPVPGAMVDVLTTYPLHKVKGNADGEYAFSGVPPGPWTVAVTYAGQTTYKAFTAIDAGLTSQVQVDLPAPKPVVPATKARFLFGPTAYQNGVTATTTPDASTPTLTDDGSGGGPDLALTFDVGTDDVDFQLSDPGGTDYRQFKKLRFNAMGGNGPVSILVRLTHDGVPFSSATQVAVTALWNSYQAPLLLGLSATEAELAGANGVRFTVVGDGADFRLDDVQLAIN